LVFLLLRNAAVSQILNEYKQAIKSFFSVLLFVLQDKLKKL
jgi:hypothetical protein